MSKLSQEEIRNLVSFTSSDGTIYLYSKITLDGNTLIYNNEKYNVSEEILKVIQEGLLNYEYYKLSMARSDAEELLTEKATAIIEEQYAERFENMTNLFTSLLEKVETALTTATHNAETASIGVLDTAEQIHTIAGKIVKMEKDINTKEINRKVIQKLNELKEVKSDVIQLIEPIAEQTSNLVKSLEQLVDIKDS